MVGRMRSYKTLKKLYFLSHEFIVSSRPRLNDNECDVVYPWTVHLKHVTQQTHSQFEFVCTTLNIVSLILFVLLNTYCKVHV